MCCVIVIINEMCQKGKKKAKKHCSRFRALKFKKVFLEMIFIDF